MTLVGATGTCLCVYISVCLWLWVGGVNDCRRHGSTDRNDPGGQQDNEDADDEGNQHDNHDQLDVLPPVGPSHCLSCPLELFSLGRERDKTIHWSDTLCIPDTLVHAFPRSQIS